MIDLRDKQRYLASIGWQRLDLHAAGRHGVHSVEVVTPLPATAMSVFLDFRTLYLLGATVNQTTLVFPGAVTLIPNLNGIPHHIINGYGDLGNHVMLGTRMHKFHGGHPHLIPTFLERQDPANLPLAVSYLIVAVSEALRFEPIRQKIANTFDGHEYQPQADVNDLMTSWSHMTFGTDVKVEFLG